jgi:hypothetical protein
MKAGEHREDKEGECFVRFGHGGGLTPSGITVKVRTCEERVCVHWYGRVWCGMTIRDFYNLREQGNVCVSAYLKIKTRPREREAQWWLSIVLFLFPWEKPYINCLSLRKEERL